MMGIIDGTGAWFDDDNRNWMPWNWGEPSTGYRTAFANSFCRQTFSALSAHGHAAMYQRGPSLLGLETGPYARRVVDWVKREHAARPKEPVFLMGFSRGAAATITAASFLRREAPNLRIAAIFLFDAVDRSVFTDAETVPGNVAACHHVVRDYSLQTWWNGRHRHNRWYFNNDALEAERGVHLEVSAPVHGSHGAMGGTPWPDHDPDPAAVVFVANWMNARLARHDLPRALDAARCYPQGSTRDQEVERMIRAQSSRGLRPAAAKGLQARRAAR